MGSLNTNEILRFAAPSGSSNLPLGFVPVDASKLVLPAASGTARIEYRAWYNAQTNELILSGSAVKQPLGGNGMGGTPTIADAGIFFDSNRQLQGPNAGAFIGDKPVAVQQTETLVRDLINPDNSLFANAKVSFAGTDSVGLAFAVSSYNLRNSPATAGVVDATITFNSWRGRWTDDGSVDSGVLDVRTPNPANRDPDALSLLKFQPGGLVLRVDTGNALAVGVAADIASQTVLDGIGSLFGNAADRAGEQAAYVIKKLLDWGKDASKEPLTDFLSGLASGAVDNPNRAADRLGWLAQLSPEETARAVKDNLSQGQYNVLNGLSPSGFALNSSNYESLGSPIVIGTGAGATTQQSAVQVTTYIDAGTGAFMEARVSGRLENGVFVPTPNSSYISGMDQAGRYVMTGQVARSAAERFIVEPGDTLSPQSNLSDLFSRIAPGESFTLSIQRNTGEIVNPSTNVKEQRTFETLEFKNASGDTAWIVDKSDGDKSLIFYVKQTEGGVRPVTGATLVVELNAKGAPKLDESGKIKFQLFNSRGDDISDFDLFEDFLSQNNLNLESSDFSRANFNYSDSQFLGLSSAQSSEISLNGRTYARDVSGDYVASLGQGQWDVYDVQSGIRYLQTNGSRVPIDSDESIFLNDAGNAFVAPKYVPTTTRQVVDSVQLDISTYPDGESYIRASSRNNTDATTLPLDPQDLAAYGFTWQNISSGELPTSATALINGLNPATLSANGQPTPVVVQTPIRDANGLIAGYERSIELANGVTLTTLIDLAGTAIGLQEMRTSGNQVTTTRYSIDADGNRIEQSLTVGTYSSSGAFIGQRTDLRTNTVYDLHIEVDGTETIQIRPSTVTQLTDQQSIAALNDIAGLIGAIQGGRPLPILSSGLRLANSITVNQPIPSLVTAGQIVSGLASLYNLSNALRNGDTLTQINASLSTLNYVNSTLPSLLGGSSPLSSGLDSFLNGTPSLVEDAAGNIFRPDAGLINGAPPGVLPVIGLIVSIRNGDPIGITSGLIGIINPSLLAGPVGWILAGFSILQSMFDSPPKAWGVAKFVFDENGQLQIDAVGEEFGTDRVRNQLQVTRDVLQQMISQAQISAPDTPLGIIPQRTPSITWREARLEDRGYGINDIDPVTGEQRYPYLRWDDNGMPFSSNPQLWQPDTRDPNIRSVMAQQLIESALRREAIAPIWEVNTAKFQQDAGDPLAGLTEQERAARMGLGPSYDPTTHQVVGQFRPVTLDLDGSGTITIAAKDEASNTIGFDWDGSGFNKQVAWVQPNDGFLFLDRDSNGVVTSGRELFSNSMVSDNYKGVKSIEWVDANRDGKINNLDPVYRELRVWQDLDLDGNSFTVLPNGTLLVDANEIKTLAELNIAELDYVNARFVRQGNLFALRSDALQADMDGTRVAPVGNGITIDYSDGRTQFIITQLTSLAGGEDRIDGIYEDGDPFGLPRATPLEISIPVSLLLSNDGAAGQPLDSSATIIAVKNSMHGVVRLGSDQFVYFTPEKNYNSAIDGDAEFEYVVRSSSGHETTVKVSIPIAAVNDAPIANQVDDASLPIYGYSTVFYSYKGVSIAIESGPAPDIPAISTMGFAIYQPYVDEVFKPIYQYDPSNLAFNPIIGYDPSEFVVRDTPVYYAKSNTGYISASDPDGQTSFRFEIIAQPLFGRAELDPLTGRWSYIGRRPAGLNVGNDAYDLNPYVNSPIYVYGDRLVNSEITYIPMIESNNFGQEESRSIDVFTVRVWDGQGAYSDIEVQAVHYGPRPVPYVQSGSTKPIALDLNNDGFSFIDVDDSNVFFDVNGDGWRRRTAWISQQDGLLAFDENSNGIVDTGLEISFARFVSGAQTDLEGLRAFDTNRDGVFSAADAAWSQFGVWQDANSNGVSEVGELRSMTDLGITQVALTSDGQFRVIDGQTVHGLGVITKADGSTLAMADVTLRYSQEVRAGANSDGTPVTTIINPAQTGQTISTGADKDIALGTNGSDNYLLGDGDDALVDDLGDDRVDAGAGNDIIFTGAGNDVILAGAGNDQIYAGEGNDAVYGDDATSVGDDLIMLQGGSDVAFGGDGKDFISGGVGNDVISGDAGDDQLFGEDGWDAIFGGEGNDELLGMQGNDFLDGGAGHDVLSGGAGADMLLGGAGNDTYEVDDSADQVDETVGSTLDANGHLVWGTGDAGGADTVNASISFDLSTGRNALIENLTLTGEAAINGTGNAGNNMLVGNSAANTLIGLDGNDTLDGGLGADTLMGGQGDDTYVIDNAGDTITELAGEGIDTVRSRISTILSNHVENLTLTGIYAINGAGNALNNDIRGNAAANVLTGGQGNDTLAGGAGNDSYVFVRGDGQDTITDRQGQNRLIFGADIAASDLRFDLQGTSLIISITQTGQPTGDQITLTDWYLPVSQRDGAQRVSSVQFADGSVVALDETALNHAPVLLADSASLTEDTAAATGNVLANDTDEDEPLTGRTLRVTNPGTYIGLYGTLTLVANGSYSYALRSGDTDIQGLRQGQTLSESFAYVVTDDAPFETATVASTLSITVTGTNDTPIVQADVDSAALIEDGLQTTSGNVLTNDRDTDIGDVLTVANAGTYQGTYGELTLAADGSYTYVLSNTASAVQSLRQGEQVADVFTLQTTDGIATVASSLTLNITGTNDAPIVQADVDSAALKEDGLQTASGNVLTNDRDIDIGDALTVANAGTYQGTYGQLVLQADGSYSYTLANNSIAVQSLRQGEQVADVFTLQTTDGIATVASSLTLNITGTNDIPVLAGTVSAQSATEIVAFNLALPTGLFTDADAATTLTYSASLADGQALPTWLNFDAATQTFTGTSAYEDITAMFGQTAGALSIRVTAMDDQGTSASADFALTVNQSPELTLLGGAGNDTLQGASRNDWLDGGAGADVMRGARGDDRYTVDNTADVVTEFFNQGNDSIYSSVNYVTPAHVENLSLTGNAALTASGNELSNVLIGNAGNNSLTGGVGTDLLAGWLGNDSLDGGQDGDTYLWNQGDGRDTITESSANSGIDVLRFGAGITMDSLVSREFTDSAGNRRLFISVLDQDGQERATEGIELALNASGVSVIERFELTGANGTFNPFNLSPIKVNTVTTSGGNGNDILTGSRADDRIAGSNGDDTLYGRSGNDVLWGDNGKDRLFGEGGDDKLWGGNDDDWLQGGAGNDEMGGDNGKDTVLGGSGDDKLYGGNDADLLDGGSGADLLIGDNGEDQLFAGEGNDTLYGGNDSDLLAAGAGNDLIDGDNGADTIIAGAGNDSITAGNDGDFVDAGSGNDSIDTGNGADFIAGGKGNDSISAGHDSDVIAFNRGDGQDTFITQDWQQDTVSLGVGIRYADLSLARSGNDLILRMGQGDEIVFKAWYQGSSGQRKNVSRLQMITAAPGGDFNATSSDRLLNKQAVQLDFAKLVTAFDNARASNAALANGWSISSNSLNTAYISGSNTQAIGGDLAWRYATLARSDSATDQEAGYGNMNSAGVRSAMNSMGSLRNWTQDLPAIVNPWIAMQAGISLITEQATGANPTLTPITALTQDQLITQALSSQQQITGVARPSW